MARTEPRLETAIIRLPRLISGNPCWTRVSKALALISIAQFQCRSVNSRAGFKTPEAALLTRISR
ncbi:MAG: hypothetical protein ACD_75C00296G0002 [uncultured bacterium]|nr:MAG: hypothetical protein ACD_75C00296G0002 [uncultured bacterium]